MMMMLYVKRTTFLTVSVSLVLMSLEKTLAHPLVADEEKYELKGPKYPLEALPIIDEIQIERAFTRKNYIKFLMKCVFFEGPCDFVGKWLKPRTLAALQSKCLACTENQNQNIEKWLLTLIRYNEDLFRLAMVKVCVDMDIEVPEYEKVKMIPFLNRKDLKKLFPSYKSRL